MKDAVLKQWWQDVIDANWADDDHGPHLVNVIARSCGWLPLVPGEKMTVTFGGARYEIRRHREDEK